MSKKISADQERISNTTEVTGTRHNGGIKHGLDVAILSIGCRLEVDTTSTPSVVYVGISVPGSSTSSSVWQITRYNYSSGVSGELADGDDSYDNVWDDRTGLSYS